MATITITLKLPFLGLNQNKVQEFEHWQQVNTQVANEILLLPKDERRKLTSKDFAHIEIASMFINQTIRNANAETKVKKFHCLPLEVNNQGWSIHKVGDTYSLSFSLQHGRSKRIPLEIHQANQTNILAMLLTEQAHKGSMKLWRSRKGIWYALLSVSMEVPDPLLYRSHSYAVCSLKTEQFIGIDMGVVKIAVDSQGEEFSGAPVEKVRQRYHNLRKTLQKKGSKSAKRHLKKISRRETNYRKDVNHVISKKLVEKAKDTQSGIAVENLKHIRDRVIVRKSQRATHHSWSFSQLQGFIEYKAKIGGVPFIIVDARNTSRECSECHHIDKKNRKTQSLFLCLNCGHNENADLNASKVISQRASVNKPIAVRPKLFPVHALGTASSIHTA